MTQTISEQMILQDDDNRITEVVVFSSQAYLKRQVKTQAQTGLNRFLIELKAFNIDADSVQANIYGSGDILSVQYKEIPTQEAVQEDIKELESQKRQLEQKRRVLDAEKENCAKQKKFLDSTISYANIQVPVELKTQFPSSENLQDILSFLKENYQKIARDDEVLTEGLEKIADEFSVLDRKFKQVKRPHSKNRKTIEVLFDANETGDVAIEVFYVALYASWKPVYKVDVSLDLSQITLTMFAHIEQRTGENWESVQLNVSNAMPMKGVKLPELSTWKVQPAYIPPSVMAAPKSSGILSRSRVSSEPESEMMLGASEEDLAVFDDDLDCLSLEEAEFVQAEEKQLPLAFEYQLPQPIDMNSGDGETLLPMFNKSLTGEFFCYAVPKQDNSVYLVCEANLENTLLAGQLNIYFGGRFVGSSLLTEKKAGESLLVNLGIERDVKISREKITDKIAESFLGGMVDRFTIARELEFRIVAENLKDKEIRLQLLDAVPISSTDKIQIKDLSLKPEPKIKDWQEKKGVMLWDTLIAAQQTREFHIRFFVKHPKDCPPELFI